MSLPNIVVDLLNYPLYWNRPPAEWGSIVDWDIFFIDQMPGTTSVDSHHVLAMDLDILVDNLPTDSRAYQKASSLRVLLKKNSLNGVWQHSPELENLSVRERLEKRKAESQAIAYATENASKKLRTHAQVQGQKVAERSNAALSSAEVEEQTNISDDHGQEENTEDTKDRDSEPNVKDQDEDLQKAWEFERPIPGWLGCIHQHCKKVTTTSGSTLQSQAASNAVSWHIIDACDVKLTDIITQQEFLELQNDITSYLPSGWMVLEPPAERCLYSISMLDKKELKKVAKTMLYDGIRGAIKEIRKIPAIRSKDKNENEIENPFLDSSSIDDATSNDKIIQEDDYNHPDVCYILELLRYTKVQDDRQENTAADKF